MASDQFQFEREEADGYCPPPRRRDPKDAELDVLLHRLHLEGAALDEDTRAQLTRFCVDVPLNILWYVRARRREQRRNGWFTLLAVALMVLALGLMVAVAVVSAAKDRDPSGAFTLTLLAGGALTVLQVIAALGDGKARLSIFWRAGADLKERLYSFERQWIGKGASSALTDAIDAELRAARAITRAERLEFFATIRSPTDVLAVALAATDALKTRRGDATQGFAARDQQIADAQKALREARASVKAAEYRVSSTPDGPAKATEQTALVAAKAEEQRSQVLLDELMGA